MATVTPSCKTHATGGEGCADGARESCFAALQTLYQIDWVDAAHAIGVARVVH
jgi:hypothetical protein